MHIVIDENIPFAEPSFGQLGDIVFKAGRAINKDDVHHADALIVRSVTQVNRRLLEDSRVSFVGSCTIGEDHLNTDDLQTMGIAYASAPGCNARSAAEYTLTVLLALAERKQWALNKNSGGITVAIIGSGNVGARVYALLAALNINTLIYDPLITPEQRIKNAHYTSWDQILNADVLTFHVPLTTTGNYPTRHMLNQAVLEQLPTHTAIINTARGDVIDEQALLHDVKRTHRPLALDVWANEPNINTELLRHCVIGTPHIAGYSLDGKLAGTRAIYHALCQHFKQSQPWPEHTIQLPTAELHRKLNAENQHPTVLLAALTQAAYPIWRDDQNLRDLILTQQKDSFDSLRKHYPIRREFPAFTINDTNLLNLEQIKGIGFQING